MSDELPAGYDRVDREAALEYAATRMTPDEAGRLLLKLRDPNLPPEVRHGIAEMLAAYTSAHQARRVQLLRRIAKVAAFVLVWGGIALVLWLTTGWPFR